MFGKIAVAAEKWQFTASQGGQCYRLWERHAVLVKHYNDSCVSNFLSFNQYNQDSSKASIQVFKAQRDWEAFWVES